MSGFVLIHTNGTADSAPLSHPSGTQERSAQLGAQLGAQPTAPFQNYAKPNSANNSAPFPHFNIIIKSKPYNIKAGNTCQSNRHKKGQCYPALIDVSH